MVCLVFQMLTPKSPTATGLSKDFFKLIGKGSNTRKTLTQVVPDVHFSAQRPDFDDALAQEIIRFPLQTLLHL